MTFEEIVKDVELTFPDIANVVLTNPYHKVVVHSGSSYFIAFPLCLIGWSFSKYTETDQPVTCKKCLRFPKITT